MLCVISTNKPTRRQRQKLRKKQDPLGFRRALKRELIDLANKAVV